MHTTAGDVYSDQSVILHLKLALYGMTFLSITHLAGLYMLCSYQFSDLSQIIVTLDVLFVS